MSQHIDAVAKQSGLDTLNSKLQTVNNIPADSTVKDYCESLSSGVYRATLASSSTALDQGGPVANAATLFITKNSKDHIQIIAVPYGRSGYTMYLLRKYGGVWGNNWINLADNNFHVGDEYRFNGSEVTFRTLSNKSGIYFAVRLPKDCASDVSSFTVQVTANSSLWFSGGNIGRIDNGTQADNISLGMHRVLIFSLPPTGTIQNEGFGICELNATITFT